MNEATYKDSAAITEMVMDYCTEIKDYPTITVDRRWVSVFVETLLGSSMKIAFVDRDGVFLGRLEHTWFGPNLIAEGIVWYVRPRARGGLLAWRLIKAFTNEAYKKGAVMALCALHQPKFQERIDGLMKLAGYKVFSPNYLRDFYERPNRQTTFSDASGASPGDHWRGGEHRQLTDRT